MISFRVGHSRLVQTPFRRSKIGVYLYVVNLEILESYFNLDHQNLLKLDLLNFYWAEIFNFHIFQKFRR